MCDVKMFKSMVDPFGLESLDLKRMHPVCFEVFVKVILKKVLSLHKSLRLTGPFMSEHLSLADRALVLHRSTHVSGG